MKQNVQNRTVRLVQLENTFGRSHVKEEQRVSESADSHRPAEIPLDSGKFG